MDTKLQEHLCELICFSFRSRWVDLTRELRASLEALRSTLSQSVAHAHSLLLSAPGHLERLLRQGSSALLVAAAGALAQGTGGVPLANNLARSPAVTAARRAAGEVLQRFEEVEGLPSEDPVGLGASLQPAFGALAKACCLPVAAVRAALEALGKGSLREAAASSEQELQEALRTLHSRQLLPAALVGSQYAVLSLRLSLALWALLFGEEQACGAGSALATLLDEVQAAAQAPAPAAAAASAAQRELMRSRWQEAQLLWLGDLWGVRIWQQLAAMPLAEEQRQLWLLLQQLHGYKGDGYRLASSTSSTTCFKGAVVKHRVPRADGGGVEVRIGVGVGSAGGQQQGGERLHRFKLLPRALFVVGCGTAGGGDGVPAGAGGGAGSGGGSAGRRRARGEQDGSGSAIRTRSGRSASAGAAVGTAADTPASATTSAAAEAEAGAEAEEAYLDLSTAQVQDKLLPLALVWGHCRKRSEQLLRDTQLPDWLQQALLLEGMTVEELRWGGQLLLELRGVAGPASVAEPEELSERLQLYYLYWSRWVGWLLLVLWHVLHVCITLLCQCDNAASVKVCSWW